MRSQLVYTGVALLLAPSGSLPQNENCEAPTSVKEQVLLQGKAALHVKRDRPGHIDGESERKSFVEEATKDLKGSEKKVERRQHLDSVMNQASELVRHRVGSDTMAAAGQEMEAIDEKVLPDILAEHKSATLALELLWGMYELAEGMVEDEVKHVTEASKRARESEAYHAACRKKEAGLLEVVEKCEAELKSIIEADAHAHVGPHPAGMHTAVARQPGMHASREQTKKMQCEGLNVQRKMERTQCEGDQHTAEQEFCAVHSEAVHARGKLADGYAMALSAYEAGVKHSRADEAARKKEFGVVEAVRCLKEHFLAVTEGSVADPAWLDECKAGESESSELNLSYNEPQAWALSLSHMSTGAEEMPCTPEFLHARLAKMPSGVKVAPCTVCTVPSDKPIEESSSGHGGHSEKFWFGFQQGVRAASGEDKGSAAHVETFEKKIVAEGEENNFARFHADLSKQILHRLPDDWSSSLNEEIHHGFMNGFEAGMEVTQEAETKEWEAAQKESGEKIDKSLARASAALEKALGMVKAAHSKVDNLERVSSGFSKASESVQVLPFGEI